MLTKSFTYEVAYQAYQLVSFEARNYPYELQGAFIKLLDLPFDGASYEEKIRDEPEPSPVDPYFVIPLLEENSYLEMVNGIKPKDLDKNQDACLDEDGIHKFVRQP